jgi:ABC transport system ATP-binding/permease protein
VPRRVQRAPTDWDTKPHRPIRYGLGARLSDIWAGRSDGKNGLPPLPEHNGPPGPGEGHTPYLAIRKHHFLDPAERERRHAWSDLTATYERLSSLDQEIAEAEERAVEARKQLDDMPVHPPESELTKRNVVEQHADEALIRARRQREHDKRRALLIAKDQQAGEAVRALRVQQAQLAGVIAARYRILEGRVRQLHEHTWRRSRTYQRHLVRRHPDGQALLPYLDLALPALPDWLTSPSPPDDRWPASAPPRPISADPPDESRRSRESSPVPGQVPAPATEGRHHPHLDGQHAGLGQPAWSQPLPAHPRD